MIDETLLTYIKQQYQLPWDGIHSIDHWTRVWRLDCRPDRSYLSTEAAMDDEVITWAQGLIRSKSALQQGGVHDHLRI